MYGCDRYPECDCAVNNPPEKDIPCPECGADLEVLGTNPINLGLAPEEGEDWGE